MCATDCALVLNKNANNATYATFFVSTLNRTSIVNNIKYFWTKTKAPNKFLCFQSPNINYQHVFI